MLERRVGFCWIVKNWTEPMADFLVLITWRRGCSFIVVLHMARMASRELGPRNIALSTLFIGSHPGFGHLQNA